MYVVPSQSLLRNRSERTCPSPRGVSFKLDFIRCLQRDCGSGQIVWLAKDELSNKDLCIKGYLNEDDMKRELRAYKQLSSAQGEWVARCYGPIEVTPERKWVLMNYCIVTDWLGPQDSSMIKKLPVQVKHQLKHAVRQMHQLGVAHGDLDHSKLWWESKHQKLFLADFRKAQFDDKCEFERDDRQVERLTQLLSH